MANLVLRGNTVNILCSCCWVLGIINKIHVAIASCSLIFLYLYRINEWSLLWGRKAQTTTSDIWFLFILATTWLVLQLSWYTEALLMALVDISQTGKYLITLLQQSAVRWHGYNLVMLVSLGQVRCCVASSSNEMPTKEKITISLGYFSRIKACSKGGITIRNSVWVALHSRFDA